MNIFIAATERFFGMARKKAQRVAGITGQPFDNAIPKKRPSLRVAFWWSFASLRRVSGSPCYQSRILPSELPQQNSNAVMKIFIGEAWKSA